MELEIIHLDMDAFYAAIEQRDNPELKGKPVIIGGTSNRGVVSTASYEARKYGIHSAMPAMKARKLCPHGVYLKPNHQKYKAVSKKLRQIFLEYTDLVEPLALDESFLNVANHQLNSIQIARQIKRRIQRELDLTASVGVSYNKFLAKLASDYKKPDGFMIISPANVEEIIHPLEVNQLWGVGPKTEQKLNQMGLKRIKDVAESELFELVDKLGARGYQLYKLANGEDNREVSPPKRPKSIGKERTFKQDSKNRKIIKAKLERLASKVAKNLADKDLACQTVTIKLKYADFNQISRSQTFNYNLTGEEIYHAGLEIFEKIELEKKLRLIGISVSNLKDKYYRQLKLFNEEKG